LLSGLDDARVKHVAIASPLRPRLRQLHDAPGSQWHEGFPAFENGRNEERYFCSTLLAQRELHKRAAAFTPPLHYLTHALRITSLRQGAFSQFPVST
jgi:hypothetical protein